MLLPRTIVIINKYVDKKPNRFKKEKRRRVEKSFLLFKRCSFVPQNHDIGTPTRQYVPSFCPRGGFAEALLTKNSYS